MTNADAIKWLENLKKDIGNPAYQSLWHYEQVLTEIIDLLVDRKTENCSEIPNNCEPQTCENRGCKNYDTINNHCMFIEQCHYEPKDELQEKRFSCLMMVQGIDCEGCPRRFTCHEQPTIEERNCNNCNQKHCFACLCHRYYHYYYEPKDELQTKLCRECDDYAGDGMYCASNHIVYDFDTCKNEPQTDDDKKHCVFCKWVYEPNVCSKCRNMNLFVDAIEDEPQIDCKTCKHKDLEGCEEPCLECKTYDLYEPQMERSE